MFKTTMDSNRLMNSRYLTYYWLHLPTNTHGVRKVDTWASERVYSAASLLQQINSWNQQQPENWLFWM